MDEMQLDVAIQVVYVASEQVYVCEAAVYDGKLYVASKRWEGSSASKLIQMARAFHLSWSALYYDNPHLTPKKVNELGFEQLRLWDPNTEA